MSMGRSNSLCFSFTDMIRARPCTVKTVWIPEWRTYTNFRLCAGLTSPLTYQ
jgi:hypothetical protein